MTIHIEALRFDAILGLLPHERETPQPVTVDATLTYTYRPDAFVDYARVAERIRTTLQEGRFELIEEAIEAIFHDIHRFFPSVETLRVKICKPAVLPDCRVCAEDFVSFL